jgi:predicted metallopeptidase
VGRFRYEPAPEVHAALAHLVDVLEFTHIDIARVHCRRSYGSTSRAYARIWELPSIWQGALGVPPQYVIEVLAEHFDPAGEVEQTKVLIHELLHIPSTFSGALRGHRGQGERIDGRTVNRYYRRFLRASEERQERVAGEAPIEPPSGPDGQLDLLR